MPTENPPLTPELLLNAYANGYFPMALNKDDPELYWFSPEERGVLPLDRFNIPRGLARAMKKHRYTLTVDTAFEQVIRACGTLTKERHETWINENIVQLYTALVYQGPSLVGAIKTGLAAHLRADGFERVSQAVGADA